MSDTLLDRLVAALDRSAKAFDGNVIAPPIAVLWPDEARQWEDIVAELRPHTKIATYGPYDVAEQQGPAYWLRCVIASTVKIDGAPDEVPIIYLPGVSRASLRELDHVGNDLASLGALQHRCQWFNHANGNDWTIRALLADEERGAGLDIGRDEATSTALVASLRHLLPQPVTRLRSRRIDATYLNNLVNPDPTRLLLDWIDDPSAARTNRSGAEWAAFIQQCESDFGFDPDKAGEIEGSRLLGEGQGAWAQVWARFHENPAEFPQIPERLRVARPDTLFTNRSAAWPQENEAAEEQLRARLLDLAALHPEGARKELADLEDKHRSRRSSVWAQLGKTPLANSLEHLAQMAAVTSADVPATSVDAIVDWYSATGWHADRAVLRSLNEVEEKIDTAAVSAALSAAYGPWLDAAAQKLQSAVEPEANAGTYVATPAPEPQPGEVVMFIDGLRLDVAHILIDRLHGGGLDTALHPTLSALPTVTKTAKPVLVPIDQARLAPGDGLGARRAPDGPAAEVAVLRALMTEAGVQVLMHDDVGDPAGTAWTEAGDLDSLGHQMGTGLAHEINPQVQRIAARIEELFEAGWNKVTIATDHGWLLLPSGLPKFDLPVAVTEVKKGRCARLKAGANVDVSTVPWHWDRDVRIALAPGITCFEKNQTYEHGGVSPQECIVPRLTVSPGAGQMSRASITSAKWRGLTLAIEFAHLPDSATVDLRLDAADAKTSIAKNVPLTSGSGKVVLLVPDEDLEGSQGFLVAVSADGSLLLQRPMTVGTDQ